MTEWGDRYYKFQEGFRRVADAADGIPDRVPVYAQICELIPVVMNETADKIYRDPELLTIGTFTICEKYGIDVPVVDLDTYNIEAEAIGQRLIYHKDIMPDIDRSRPLIRSKSDLVKVKTPDFKKAGRCSLVVEMYRLFEKLTNVKAGIAFCAPFSLAANIRGISEIIMDIMVDPDFAHDLFTCVTEDVLIPYLQFLKAEFPHAPAMVGADALASLPMINEDIMHQWVAPYIERLREAVGPNVCVPNQTGERHSKTPEIVMDIRRRCNPLYVEGQDPDVEALGPEFYKQYALKYDLPLLLGVGAAFLNNSTPDEVTARVKHYVQIGGKNGRLWLYLCNLSPSTPEENIRSAIEAAHRYGTYN
jgi:uroporphyrinogen-III decarboxylase